MAKDKKPRTPTSQETIDKIIELNKAGVSEKDISIQLSIRLDTVKYYLRKNNLIYQSKVQCKTCIYGDAEGYCGYILYTGHMRTCPSSNCTVRVEGERLSLKGDWNSNNFNGSKLKLGLLYSQATFEVEEM